VPLINAYFDESGTDDLSPVMSVAGYLFDAERAKAFDTAWSAALKENALTHFHMVACAHGNEEYANLSKPERISLATHLIGLIKSHVTRGVGAIMPTGMYEQMPYHPNLGGAYNYCLWSCLEGARMWRSEAGNESDIAYFFEGGHKSQSEANRIMNLTFRERGQGQPYGYISHNFVDKRRFAGIQAADILAWQMCVDWKHGRDGVPRRKDFASLVEQRDHKVKIINAELILQHVREMTEARAWG